VTLLQAIILGAYYWFTNSYCFSYRYAAARPILVGLITGVVLGDPMKGAIVGATINLAYIGVMFVGGSIPSDTGLASLIGVSMAIIGGLDTEAALAVAFPLGLLGNIVHYTRMVYFSFFVRLSDKYVAEGKEDKLWLTNVFLPQLTLFFLCFIPATLALYFGVDYVAAAVKALSGSFFSIINVMAGMLPAIGIAITLSIIYKGEAKPFFFIGYLLVALFKLSMIQTCFLAVLMAIIYINLKGAVGGGAGRDEKKEVAH
jgi:mannose/fructose/N-acetylgalactosamine-specific phosphotransferase system component IIC